MVKALRLTMAGGHESHKTDEGTANGLELRPVLGNGSASASKDELEKTADKDHKSEHSESAADWGTVRRVFVVCLLCLLQMSVGGAYSVVGSFFSIEV